MTPPPLPTGHTIGCGIFNGQKLFTADQMRAYGAACAAAAVAQEREECATLCDEKHALRSADGFPREASTARALAASIRARETP